MTQLTITIYDIAIRHIEKDKQLVVYMLDFSKSFNTVPNDKLLYKLES